MKLVSNCPILCHWEHFEHGFLNVNSDLYKFLTAACLGKERIFRLIFMFRLGCIFGCSFCSREAAEIEVAYFIKEFCGCRMPIAYFLHQNHPRSVVLWIFCYCLLSRVPATNHQSILFQILWKRRYWLTVELYVERPPLVIWRTCPNTCAHFHIIKVLYFVFTAHMNWLN